MPVVIGILSVLLAIVCLLLILIVLMQRPRQEGLGAAFGSGMTDQMFGAHTTNVLQKGTTWLGISFFLITFALAVLIAKTDKKQSDLPALVDPAELKTSVPAVEVPAAPAVEAPKPAAPAVEAPKPAAPAVEAPKPAVPAAEAPKPAVPAVEAPKPAAPAAEAPKP